MQHLAERLNNAYEMCNHSNMAIDHQQTLRKCIHHRDQDTLIRYSSCSLSRKKMELIQSRSTF